MELWLLNDAPHPDAWVWEAANQCDNGEALGCNSMVGKSVREGNGGSFYRAKNS
jgi:hypothetical protein